jgi:O-antigen ligase/tetratricopeptide (TPR) repeat protein
MLKSILRWVAVGALFAVPVIIPFIVSATMFFPYITGKNFTFRILVEIAFSAWVLLALLDAKYRPKFSWVLAAFTTFIVIVGIADLQGANFFKSFWSNFERMEGYIALLHLFAYFLVASSVLSTQRLWNAFWYSSLTASVAIAFIGLKPIIDTLPHLTYPRIDATFGNPIYLAVYSLFHIFIALVLMARWRGTHWHQFLLGLVVLMHLAVMVLTQTRGTVLGFLGGAVITTILIASLERSNVLLRRIALGALVGLILLVGVGFALKNNQVAQQNRLVSRFTQMSLSEGTINARFMNWGIAWQGIKERPLLGYGQDNYEYVFSKHFDPNMWGQEPWFDRTHDIIFDWLIAAGFLGLTAYALILLTLLAHLWVFDPNERHWSMKSFTSFGAIKTLLTKKSDTFTATERALFTGLIAAYTFHNLFVFDNIVSYILFVSVLAYLHMKATEGHDPLWAKATVSNEMVMSVALPLTLVVGGVIFYYANMPGINTAQTIIQALIPQRALADGTVVQNTPKDILAAYKQALSYDQLGRQEVREQLVQAAANMQRAQGVDEVTKAAFRDLAVTELKREIDRNPDSARLWLFMGSLNSSIGRISDADAAFTEAVKLTPTKQNALFQLAEVKLAENKDADALELFKKAYELAPAYEEAAKLYALALIRNGKDKEAVDLLTKQFGTAAVDDSRLFVEWTNAKRFDIAAMILEARRATNPNDLQTEVSLAAAYKELGRKDEAIALLNGIIVSHPEYKDQMNTFIKQIRGY